MNPCGFEFPDVGGHLTEHYADVAAALNMSREVLTCHSSRQRNGPVKSDVNWNVQRPSVRPAAAACWQNTLGQCVFLSLPLPGETVRVTESGCISPAESA